MDALNNCSVIPYGHWQGIHVDVFSPRLRPRGMTVRESGSVLILALWMVVFLGFVVASLSFRLSMALAMTRYQWEEIQRRQLAKMAVAIGCSVWRDEQSGYAAFNQPWNNNEGVFKDHPIDNGVITVSRIVPDDRGVDQEDFGMEDESGKINLNKATPDVLQRLFSAHVEVVPAILDWRDPESQKNFDYSSWGYTRRGGPFRSVEELLLVKGMTPSIYEEVKEVLTVYTSGPVNINTATAPVLSALGLPDSLIFKILFFRKGKDGISGTADDGVFDQQAQIPDILKAKCTLTDAEMTALTNALNHGGVSVQAESFQLHVSARLEDSRVWRHYSVIMTARATPGQILYWQEGN